MNFPVFGEIPIKRIITDPSALLLLFTNILAIFFTIYFKMQFSEVFLIYYLQGLIIGFFHALKIFLAKNLVNTEWKKDTKSKYKKVYLTNSESAFNFIMIYSIFYIFFSMMLVATFSMGYPSIILTEDFRLISGSKFGIQDLITKLGSYSIIITTISFFITHTFSFLYYLFAERQFKGKKDSQNFISKPLLRVIPMFGVFILLSFFNEIVLLIFVLANLILRSISKKKRYFKEICLCVLVLIFLFLYKIYSNPTINDITMLVLFMLIKTGIDLIAHMNEHNSFYTSTSLSK